RRSGNLWFPVLENIKNTTWIGTIAELTNNKGLEYSIRAINELVHDDAVPQFTYVIIGDGEDKDDLLGLIKKLHLDDVVFIKSRSADAATLIRAFDVFLLPSLKEGLPYTLLEAGLAGMPTIASDVGGIPEIITHGVSGLLVEPGKSKDVAFAIQTFLGNKELAHHYGDMLKIHTSQKFSIQNMVENTAQLYK
ncbi:glycosyltransferase family 4 protein, partial [Patescibacteria group bacterium]